MKKLAEVHPEKLLDLLTERLTFERAGVKLYDTVVGKMKAASDKQILGMIGQMTKQRMEEKEHEEWLEDRVRELGSDAHSMTELAELVERESAGIMEVIAGDSELPHLFHALLTAELVDDSGWKLLLQLADEAGDADALREFRVRADEEEKHLIYIRRVVSTFASNDLLGKTGVLPVSI